jgi:hypothetical protein
MARLARLATAEAVQAPGWADEVRTFMGPPATHRQVMEAICASVLTSENAIAHPAWSTLVMEILRTTESLEELAKDLLDNGDDEPPPDLSIVIEESGVVDGYSDARLYTFDIVFDLLATPAAVAHPDWERLALAVCDVKQASAGGFDLGENEARGLLLAPAAIAHPAYPRVAEAIGDAYSGLARMKPDDECVLVLAAAAAPSHAGLAVLVRALACSAGKALELARAGSRTAATGKRMQMETLARALVDAGMSASVMDVRDANAPAAPDPNERCRLAVAAISDSTVAKTAALRRVLALSAKEALELVRHGSEQVSVGPRCDMERLSAALAAVGIEARIVPAAATPAVPKPSPLPAR